MHKKSTDKYVTIITFLVSFSLICSSIFPFFPVVMLDKDSILLRYEVDDVFFGSLKHKIYIENPTPHSAIRGNLFVPLIRNESARHYAVLENISSSAGQPTIFGDDCGNAYAFWRDLKIGGKQTFSIEMNYYILSFSIRYSVNSSLVGNYNESADLYMKYTQPEELIQSNNSDIVSKAESITRDESNVHAKVSKIYDFVITHLRYAAQEDERGALWALKNAVGDCSEFSYLFVALCRAAGIPARIQAGYALRSMTETLEDGHMWAEYYLENYGWIPVDATWRLFDMMDHRHFSSIQSMPEIIHYANFVFNNTLGPEPVDKQTVVLQPLSSDFFGEEIPVEKTINAVKQIKSARFALFLAKVFGATSIFPSEAANAEKTFLESQVNLQNAIDLWENSPQLAQLNASEALEGADEATGKIWMLIVKEIILFASILVAVMVAVFFILKRYQAR